MTYRSVRHAHPFNVILWLVILAGICLLLGGGGCVSGPPTTLERAWFDVSTNTLPQVTTEVVRAPEISSTNRLTTDPATGLVTTNTVTVTNWVEQTRFITNAVETYTLAPGAGLAQAAQTGANISNLLAPGSGGLVAAAITGLGWIWSSIRNRKNGKIAAGGLQAIQVFRSVLQTTEEGKMLDRELTRWLMKHQIEAGISSEVLQLIQGTVSNDDARRVAAEILAILRTGDKSTTTD